MAAGTPSTRIRQKPIHRYFGGAHRLHGRYFCRANPNAISIFDLAKKRQPSRWYVPPVRVTNTFLFMSAAGGLATDLSSGGPVNPHHLPRKLEGRGREGVQKGGFHWSVQVHRHYCVQWIHRVFGPAIHTQGKQCRKKLRTFVRGRRGISVYIVR